MAVPHIFVNRRVPQDSFDIDADKINENFAKLADGSALDPASIGLVNASPDLIAAIGGFLQNFLINGSFESFDGSAFQRWTFDDTADPTATIGQTSTPADVRFGQRAVEIDTGTGPAGVLFLLQSLLNPTDLASLTLTCTVFVKAGSVGSLALRVNDGVGSTLSPANVGSGVYEQLTVTHVVNALNTELTVQLLLTA